MSINKRKTWKIILIAMSVIVVVIVAAGVYIGARWKQIVQTHLESKTQQLSKGLYHAKLGGMRVELLRRRIKIENIELQVDSTVHAHLQAIDSLPPIIADFSLKALEVHGIRFSKTDHGKILKLKNLWFDQPHIHLVQTFGQKEKNKKSTPKTPYQLISPALSSVCIEEILINDGYVEFSQQKTHDPVDYHVGNIELKIRDFLVDSTVTSYREMLECNDIRLEIGQFKHILPNGLFEISFNKMEIGLTDSTLICNGLKLTPKYGKNLFAAKNPRHTNWMELGIEHIRCMKVDYQKILFEKSVNIDSIFIEDFRYTNMKNREVEQAPIVKPMLYKYVQQTPVPLDIRTIHAQKGTVVYEDQPIGKTESGIVNLNRMEGDFYDITNIISHKNQYMTIRASAYVQDEGILRTTFKFPVDPNNNHFNITGTMGHMHLNRLNSMLEPFLVSIKDGMVDHIDFTINGNNKQASLDMLFCYNDLHISLFKEKHNQLVRRSLLSGIANGMVLFNDNPSTGHVPRRSQTVTERNIYRASFHYFWHILMAGFEETIGITKKKQDQLNWLKQEAVKMHIIKEE